MRATRAYSHAVRTVGLTSESPRQGADWQALKDKLCVAAVALLILATATMFALYVAHELPHWRTWQIGTIESSAPPAIQEREATAAMAVDAPGITASTEHTGSQVSLVLWSTLFEMAIFCGLGLYLRHDMNRKP